ncbi:hypothetical protein RJT34_09447 [Clitoria ternatea]|uniref:Nucleotide-diphospho-sugar transferase domain-containing protein n=1 Tax=Clitoria ternatea TaxID=43366 RepID=A0AAN9PWD3_CLITE
MPDFCNKRPKGHQPLIGSRRMRDFGLRKSLYLPLTAFLIFILLICFVRHHHHGSLQKGVREVIDLKPRSINRLQEEFIRVLRRTTMPDRTVILTMVDETLASPGSLLEILLQSFKNGEGTQRLLNHLMIITMDPQAFEYCSSLHPHCIHPSTFPRSFATKTQSNNATPNYNIFTWTRNDVLLEVLRFGYSIIFTDADVLWLRSPLINFNPISEISISCGWGSDGQKNYLHDGGVFYLKANAISFEFFKHWKLAKVLYPNSNYGEESMCVTILRRQDIVKMYGFRIQPVNTTSFGGFCQLNKDMLKTAYTIRANCCDDLTSKVHDLRNVLEDWIHFRNRNSVSGDDSSDKMVLRWPQKCSRRKYKIRTEPGTVSSQVFRKN